MAGRRQVFSALDGMRGVAALIVVERHRPEMFFGTPAHGGHLAVDLFFILSGFVIAYAYAQRLSDGLGLGRFMLARVIRLYPLYLLATLFGAALFAAQLMVAPEGGARSWDRLAVSLGFGLIFLPTPMAWSFDANALFPINGPAWSLFFELAVNLAFALLILRLTLPVLLTLVAAGAVLFGGAALWAGTADIGYNAATFLGGFPRVTFGFFMGVMLFRIWQARPDVALPSWLTWALLALVALTMLWPMPAAGSGMPRVAFEMVVCFVVFPIVVLAGACTQPGPRGARLCAVLGASSYGVYVFHMPASRFVVAAAERLGFDIAALAPLIGVAFLACLFAFAVAIHHAFDVPVRRWLTARLLGKGRVAHGGAEVARAG
jgi:peptidoglycan/LPS O-acetylase OafA/YrhL